MADEGYSLFKKCTFMLLRGNVNKKIYFCATVMNYLFEIQSKRDARIYDEYDPRWQDGVCYA